MSWIPPLHPPTPDTLLCLRLSELWSRPSNHFHSQLRLQRETGSPRNFPELSRPAANPFRIRSGLWFNKAFRAGSFSDLGSSYKYKRNLWRNLSMNGTKDWGSSQSMHLSQDRLCNMSASRTPTQKVQCVKFGLIDHFYIGKSFTYCP